MKKFVVDRMDEDIVRKIFGRNEAHVDYYLGLRRAKDMMREDFETWSCDPRDEMMKERLRQSEYRYTPLTRESEDDDLDIDPEGYNSKQTALDPHQTSKDDDIFSDVVEENVSGNIDVVDASVFECGQQGCTKKFSSLAAYESHYHTCHHYTCATCRRIFVSSFMLDVHIQENHDSYFQVLCTRIDMYQCLVESCELKFRTAEHRKDHVVKVHKYPSNFSFHKPVAESQVKKVPKGDNSDKMDCQDGDNDLSSKSKTKTSIRQNNNMVPSQICFGRGAQRALPRKTQKPRKQQNKAMEET